MKDFAYNILGALGSLFLLILWFLLVERHRPARMDDYGDDPGYGDDDFIVRTDDVEGYKWGEREI